MHYNTRSDQYDDIDSVEATLHLPPGDPSHTGHTNTHHDVMFTLINGCKVSGSAVGWVEGFLPLSWVVDQIKLLEIREDEFSWLRIAFDQVHFLQLVSSVNRAIPSDFPPQCLTGHIAALSSIKELLDTMAK